MSAWGSTATKRGVDDLVASVAENRTPCVVILGHRKFDDGEAIKLAAAIRRSTSLTELRCSGHAIGEAGARALGDAIGASSSVRCLDAGDATLGDGGCAALCGGALRSAALRVLELEGKGVGDAGLGALCAGLPASRVEALVLCRNAFGDAGLAALAAAVAERPLGSLDVSENANVTTGVAALFARVAELRCAHLAPGALDAAAAAAAFGTRLRALDVSSWGLGARDVAALARAAPPGLAELRLANNAAGPDGAAAIGALRLDLVDASGNGLGGAGVAALATCAISVFAHDNGVGDDGAVAVAAALADAPRLRTLGVAKNDLGDAGAYALAAALDCCAVATLEIGGNHVGADGAAALRDAQKRRPEHAPLDVAMLDDRPPPDP